MAVYLKNVSQCSKECGGGEKTRKVICLKEEKVVLSDQCNYKTKLEETETCMSMSCKEGKISRFDSL